MFWIKILLYCTFNEDKLWDENTELSNMDPDIFKCQAADIWAADI